MRFNRLDLNLLVALDHMIALRSVSRTAEKMNLSQSAMSNALNRLREFFDDPLLVQVGRNMELTPKAKAIQPSLRDIIVRIEAALTSDMSFDPSCSTREFRLIMSDFTMTVLMPHLLSITSEGNAAVRFRFIPQVEQPDVAIEHGDADVLIAPESLISKHHPYEPLFEDTFVCVAWRHGAYGDGVLTEQDYGRAQHVRMVPPRTTYSFDNQILSELGIERNVDVYCYSFSSLPYLVIGHDRLATVQRSLAEKLAHSLPLTLHPMPMPFPRMRQCIQWHDYKSQDPALTWLRQTLHLAVKRMFALPVPALPVSAQPVA